MAEPGMCGVLLFLESEWDGAAFTKAKGNQHASQTRYRMTALRRRPGPAADPAADAAQTLVSRAPRNNRGSNPESI